MVVSELTRYGKAHTLSPEQAIDVPDMSGLSKSQFPSIPKKSAGYVAHFTVWLLSSKSCRYPIQRMLNESPKEHPWNHLATAAPQKPNPKL